MKKAIAFSIGLAASIMIASGGFALGQRTTPTVAIPEAEILSGDEYVSYVLVDFEPPRPGMGNVPHAVALEVFFDYDACIKAVLESEDVFLCVPYEM